MMMVRKSKGLGERHQRILDFIQAQQQQVEAGLRDWRAPMKALLVL